MSRDELTQDAIAELAALDAIIAGESVGEEHLELAALVDSVRAQVPPFTEASAQRVEERLAHRQARTRRLPTIARPRLALAGGTFVALGVALVALLASGALTGSPNRGVLTPSFRSSTTSPGAALHGSAGGGVAALPAAGSGATASFGATASPGATSVPAPSTTRPLPNTNPSHRLVARNASLTLAATPDQFQTVANEVVSSTVRLGGIVQSSNVDVHGLSSYASFSLSVPSGRLPALIGALSSLAAVRSLDQGTTDITDTYDTAAARVAEEKAERTSLLRQLAAATTLAQQQAIEAKIAALDAKLAAATHQVGELLSRGHNARVALAIVATRAAGGSGGSSGPVNRALNDALSVLEVALAIALVALAIVVPVGLVALALWWAAATLRQRSRERVLAASRP